MSLMVKLLLEAYHQNIFKNKLTSKIIQIRYMYTVVYVTGKMVSKQSQLTCSILKSMTYAAH